MRLRSIIPKRVTSGKVGTGVVALWIAKSAVVGIFIFAGCGPVGPIPGGALRGDVGSVTSVDWAKATKTENAQLETRPNDPHSVNTWFAPVGGQLYIPTSMISGPNHPDGRSWVAHVATDDRVRIRLGEIVYERRAVRVPDDSPEYWAARNALEARYDIAVADRDPERVIWIFRVDPWS